MDHKGDSVAQQLLHAFMQFRKIDWNKRSFKGYKSSELTLLYCLKRKDKPDSPGLMVSEISQFLQVTPPTVTQLVNGLEKDGVVERTIDKIDRRAVRIKLTEKGEHLAKESKDAFFVHLKELVDFLGEEDSEKLAELLSKVFIYFNEHHSK